MCIRDSLYNLVVIDRYRPELGVKFGQPGAIFYCRLDVYKRQASGRFRPYP